MWSYYRTRIRHQGNPFGNLHQKLCMIWYIFVNAPYFNVLRVESEERMVFLGGHPAKCWPPTNVCAVCVCACVLLCLAFIIAVHLGNKVIFLPVITADIIGNSIPTMPHRPFWVPPCRRLSARELNHYRHDWTEHALGVGALTNWASRADTRYGAT